MQFLEHLARKVTVLYLMDSQGSVTLETMVDSLTIRRRRCIVLVTIRLLLKAWILYREIRTVVFRWNNCSHLRGTNCCHGLGLRWCINDLSFAWGTFATTAHTAEYTPKDKYKKSPYTSNDNTNDCGSRPGNKIQFLFQFCVTSDAQL